MPQVRYSPEVALVSILFNDRLYRMGLRKGQKLTVNVTILIVVVFIVALLSFCLALRMK